MKFRLPFTSNLGSIPHALLSSLELYQKPHSGPELQQHPSRNYKSIRWKREQWQIVSYFCNFSFFNKQTKARYAKSSSSSEPVEFAVAWTGSTLTGALSSLLAGCCWGFTAAALGSELLVWRNYSLPLSKAVLHLPSSFSVVALFDWGHTFEFVSNALYWYTSALWVMDQPLLRTVTHKTNFCIHYKMRLPFL